MSSTINLALQVSVVAGPSVSVSKKLDVEAYDKINVTIPAAAADKEVQIQPGLSSQVQLILLKASKYGADLKYKVHVNTNPDIVLDQDQLFSGAGQVGLLGANLDKLFFTNGFSEDVTLEILIGRDATP
ncbi:MAG: hypothetical protein HGA78_00080 [Nitrospirales bacterium]|nr:hypothetical protein [Nitrospirales bacterium]